MDTNEARFGKLAEDFGETEFNPEELEEHERLRVVAENIIDCYDWDPQREDFLVVTDTKVMADNPIMLRALEHELDSRIQKTKERNMNEGQAATRHGRYQILTTEASPKSATPFGEAIGEAMRDKPVLIITSMSRSHSAETGTALRGDIGFTQEEAGDFAAYAMAEKFGDDSRMTDQQFEKLEQLAKEQRSRIVSITKGHNPYEILTQGAVLEKVENLRERADKVTELMRDVEWVHVTTPIGTDIRMRIRPEFSEVEDGRMNVPGKASNYPIGEWSCSPDWNGADGVLVVDGPCGGNINQDVLDRSKPMRLTVKDGEIIGIEGEGEARQMWESYLESGNNEHNDAFRLAEFAVGTNGRALEEKPREYWGSSEGEKKYGTAHIAVGSNGTFGRKPSDPNFNSAKVHCDMVLGLNSGGEVTVTCERKNGSTFTLVEAGQPVGY